MVNLGHVAQTSRLFMSTCSHQDSVVLDLSSFTYASFPLSSLEDDTSIQRTMYSTQLASSFISHFQV